MTTLKIATDVHLYGPHQLYDPRDMAIDHCDYLIGDIVDMWGVEKKKINEAADKIEYLNNIYLSRYIKGNHEMLPREIELQIITVNHMKVLLCHGHIPLWGREKSDLWMGQDIGAGCFKRSMTWIYSKFRGTFGGLKVSDSNLKKLSDYAKMHKCQTIIIGHHHPKETYQNTHKGIKIIILKRGITDVEL